MMLVAAVWMIFEEAGRAGAVKAIATPRRTFLVEMFVDLRVASRGPLSARAIPATGAVSSASRLGRDSGAEDVFRSPARRLAAI
jgi:hypothetical protein